FASGDLGRGDRCVPEQPCNLPLPGSPVLRRWLLDNPHAARTKVRLDGRIDAVEDMEKIGVLRRDHKLPPGCKRDSTEGPEALDVAWPKVGDDEFPPILFHGLLAVDFHLMLRDNGLRFGVARTGEPRSFDDQD